ncbi:MAG: penicillin-binding protein 1C [Anaerolineae bacterium CG_4_9_14_3_um_filter_57_17]|nr:penicillin-binding protein 1C [bacterium]NCT19586.1 penicillin-binding protein 1C [bacterium]OIO86936.1 MAG: penicillin-binding protein 1C [Anaerolineae bacterium CG2_30_57_67]PJB66527.1 MAG: penicillin-binding protein 1C [Anaerolineae bacterium CG_4_9_14_3_um_filter_57_17]
MRFSPKFFLFTVVVALALGLVVAYATFADLPAIASLPERLNTPSIRITDRNGRPLYEILPENGGRHAVIALESIPLCMKQAAIAVEDENFYTNPGVDAQGILRALWINLQGGETLAGGSTITQQVARNLLLRDELSQRTLRRKLRESVLAWQMARALSKDEILALYLNQTFYGGFAYGVEAAAQTYFGKPAADLLLPECALLAGLPQAPAFYNPFTHSEAAKERQRIVLGLMEKDGFISSAERQQAEQTPLTYNVAPFPIRAPHFIWQVKAELDALALDPRASLVVRTSLDLSAQTSAEDAISHQIDKFKQDNDLDHNLNNAAAVVLDARSGEILALAGSADYFDASIAGAVNMAIARRQPGSAFKPFLYAQAFDPLNPSPWTAATPLFDVETTFITGDGQPYLPKNYDGREHGPVSARVALASSLNIPAVATLQKVGVNEMTRLANRLSIESLSSPDEYDLSLALGGGQMSLLELTNAYAALANNGFFSHYRAILDIRDADGNLLYQPAPPAPVQVFDPRAAWLISDILSDDNARQLGFGKNSTLQIERPAAVKTGTTTNFHDNWTIGYTPSLVVGVWVGNSDYQSMRDVNGLTGAAPIWQDIIRALLRGKPAEAFIRPDGLIQREVCTYSGLLPTPLCDKTALEWFIAGTEPTQPDNVYRQIWLDAATGQLASEATPSVRRQPVTVLDLPPQAQRWARSQGLILFSDFSSVPAVDSAALVLRSPQAGAEYRLAATLPREAQQLPVEVLAGAGVRQVTLWVDGVQVAVFDAPPYTWWWFLSEGEHRFQARGTGADGQPIVSAEVKIRVTR